MTKEEFDKLPFDFTSHMALSDCHISLYKNKEYGITLQRIAKKKGFLDFGKTKENVWYKGKWYSKKKFINEIIKNIEL